MFRNYISHFKYNYGLLEGFFRYTETVFRRNYRNTPKISVKLLNRTEISVEHYPNLMSLIGLAMFGPFGLQK